MNTIKRLNELSEELYGEFGFATLNEAQMDLVLQHYIDLELQFQEVLRTS